MLRGAESTAPLRTITEVPIESMEMMRNRVVHWRVTISYGTWVAGWVFEEDCKRR